MAKPPHTPTHDDVWPGTQRPAAVAFCALGSARDRPVISEMSFLPSQLDAASTRPALHENQPPARKIFMVWLSRRSHSSRAAPRREATPSLHEAGSAHAACSAAWSTPAH